MQDNHSTPELSKLLEELEVQLEKEPSDWELRKRVTQAQHDLGRYFDAANTIWTAPEIPPIDVEIAFSVRALAKGKPRRALRLLHAVLEQNQGKPVKNLAIANALLHHGMVMEAARFYGVALAEEPLLMDPEFEYWLMWVDDSQKIWGEWENDPPKLEELPWVKRDEKLIESLGKESDFTLTTPIKIPTLRESAAEKLDDIEHVHHSPKPEAGALAPPSIQFNKTAREAIGNDAILPGQRKPTDKAPSATGKHVESSTPAQANSDSPESANRRPAGPQAPNVPQIDLPDQ